MILLHSLEGVISGISPDGIDLEVGGLGFFLLCSKSVLRDAVSGQRMKVLTSLQVSESGPLLFGFSDEEERVLFQLLLKVRG
ncbi:MAG: Holliday junction branch migration protein RuvA, partial [Synergistaceae bacterium]|nr:Holliday junction branch migration protein RuvA [Synergistaceae bacterium]